MAEPYLANLRNTIERASLSKAVRSQLLCKHFFSGAACYFDGTIFMSLTPVGLALKLSEDDRKTAFAKGAKPLKYFPKAPVKKDYAVLPSRLIKDDALLRDWISRSIAFVRS